MNGTIESDVIEYPASDVIEYLVDRKFKPAGDAPFPSFEEWQQERDRQERDRLRKGWSRIMGKQEAAYRAELQCMPMSDLSTLFEQVIKQEAEKDRADFDHWSKMPRWTLDEATALSFGKAPEFVNWDKVKACHGQSSFADDYSKRRSLLLRAQEAKELPLLISPAEFITWAEQTSVALPQDLVDAVRATVGRIEDRRSLASERDELREELKRLKEEAARNKPLLTRERETYQKMILGIAIKGYGYNPTGGRSDKPREIADDLADLQIPVSDDTVRQKLNDAFDTVGLLPEVIETLK
jgi:hypothetical protein